MNNDNLFCENLYHLICELFDNAPLKYTVHKGKWITTVTILPKGFYEVINNMQHKEYLYTLKIGFNDKGQQIEICLREKEDGTKYVVLKLYSKTSYVKIDNAGKESERWNTVHDSLKRTFLIFCPKISFLL